MYQASAADNGQKPKQPLSKKRKRKLGDVKEKREAAQPKRHLRQGPKLTPPATVCFVCQTDGAGEIMRCSKLHCSKIYHRACLNIPSTPEGSTIVSFSNHSFNAPQYRTTGLSQ